MNELQYQNRRSETQNVGMSEGQIFFSLWLVV